jgi:hypothetical protein
VAPRAGHDHPGRIDHQLGLEIEAFGA